MASSASLTERQSQEPRTQSQLTFEIQETPSCAHDLSAMSV